MGGKEKERMYNRYIPQETAPVRVPEEGTPARSTPPPGLGGALSGLLRSFHLEKLDTGDILLALIVLFLLLEDGDELDLVITLGLTLLLSLGES